MAFIAALTAFPLRQSPFSTAKHKRIVLSDVTFAIFRYPAAGFAPSIRKRRSKSHVCQAHQRV